MAAESGAPTARDKEKNKIGTQGLSFIFFTEMFADHLGMPWRSTSGSRLTGWWPLIYVDLLGFLLLLALSFLLTPNLFANCSYSLFLIQWTSQSLPSCRIVWTFYRPLTNSSTTATSKFPSVFLIFRRKVARWGLVNEVHGSSDILCCLFWHTGFSLFKVPPSGRWKPFI